MATKSLRTCLAFFAILTVLGTVQPARSQGWPQRPVRIIVPFLAGGNTDAIARIIGQQLGEVFGQKFVVENRPGAAGAIAAEAVARAPADGYTLLMAAVALIAIAPAATKVSYDPVKDFAPISIIGTNPFALVVNPKIPVHTVEEFVDYARRQPDKLTYATGGAGSVSRLSMGLFLKRAGLEMVPVSYNGGGPAVADVIAGHVQSYFANLSDTLPHVMSGGVRLLAVSSEIRIPQIPNVATFIESGFPGFKISTWNGLVAPANTPKEITERIAKEVALAVKDPKLAERLAGFGIDPLGNSPEEFAAVIAADIVMWTEAVKIAGVQEK